MVTFFWKAHKLDQRSTSHSSVLRAKLQFFWARADVPSPDELSGQANEQLGPIDTHIPNRGVQVQKSKKHELNRNES